MSSTLLADARSRRVFWWVLLGAWLLQAAWIVALPAFRGIDEIDHVLRADSLVHGQLRSTTPALEGRGHLVAVRPGTLAPAAPLCRDYDYTKPDNCRAVEALPDGKVLVASAAATYNPAWYAAIGMPVRSLDGTGFDLALRLASSTLCALLLAMAAAVTARNARTAWPWLALAVCATPTLVYSNAVAAPNGPAYSAGLLWWTCAAAVVAGKTPRWGLLTFASVVLVLTHTLNVVLLPLMVLAVLLLQSHRWWAAVLRTRPAAGAVATTVATGVAAVGWILASNTNSIGERDPAAASVPPLDLATKPLLWVMQTVAAYPMRNQPDHPAVYAVWLLVVGWLLVLGARHGRRRERAAMALVASAWFLVPLVLTVHSYAQIGFAWQGRYALPLVAGLPVLAAAVLEARGTPLRRPHAVVAGVMLALAHLWAPVALVGTNRGYDLSASLLTATSLPVAAGVVGFLSAAGLLCFARAAGGAGATVAEHHEVHS